MRSTRLLFGALCALVLCAGPLAAQWERSPADVPHDCLGVGWWKARVTQQEARAKTQHDTVLVGDSITHNWDVVAPDLQKQYFGDALNLGMSTDRTQEVLWRIARIDWKIVAPKRIMLMIGTNNTNFANTPEETFAGIKAIVAYLRKHCPQAQITVLKIFPRGDNGNDPKRKTNAAVNAKLDALAAVPNVHVRDIGRFFLMPDNDTLNKALMPDTVHPTKEGHRLWAAAVWQEFMNDYKTK